MITSHADNCNIKQKRKQPQNQTNLFLAPIITQGLSDAVSNHAATDVAQNKQHKDQRSLCQ